MLNLNDLDHFSKDLKKFTEVYNQLDEGKFKEMFKTHLDMFKHFSELVNNAHDPSFNNDIDPSSIKDSVINLNETRLRLNKFVKDYLDN